MPANNPTGDSLSVHKKGFQCDFDEDVDRFAAAQPVGVLRYIVEDVVDTRLHFTLFHTFFFLPFFSKNFILYNVFVFSITFFHFIDPWKKKKGKEKRSTSTIRNLRKISDEYEKREKC